MTFQFADWGVDLQFDGPVYVKTATENINSLLKEISNKGQGGIQYIALFDEVSFDKNGFNFKALFNGIHSEKVLGLVGVNPAGLQCPQDPVLEPPEGGNVKNFKLKTKHRNAFHIANLLTHFNTFCEAERSFKFLSTAEDTRLDMTNTILTLFPSLLV